MTTTGPVVAIAGTGTVMPLSFQLVGKAVVPLNVTRLPPVPVCRIPKPTPEICTTVFVAPEVGDIELMEGGGSIVRLMLALVPPTVTTREPLVAVVGTAKLIALLFQLAGATAAPPKVNVLLPCVVPKLFPEMVTVVPVLAGSGFTPLIVTGTVNAKALLFMPATVTTTLPVEAFTGTRTVIAVLLHVVTLADKFVVLSKRTVLAPWAAPKLFP